MFLISRFVLRKKIHHWSDFLIYSKTNIFMDKGRNFGQLTIIIKKIFKREVVQNTYGLKIIK